MTHIPKVRRKKWDPKSEDGVFVGYAAGSKGYRIYNPRTKKVFVSRDVVFINENSDEERSVVPEPDMLQFRMTAAEVNLESEPGNDDDANESGDEELPEPAGDTELPEPTESALPPQQEDPQCVVRRSGRERHIPGKYNDFQLSFSAVPQINSPSQVSHGGEPQTYAEALRSEARS